MTRAQISKRFQDKEKVPGTHDQVSGTLIESKDWSGFVSVGHLRFSPVLAARVAAKELVRCFDLFVRKRSKSRNVFIKCDSACQFPSQWESGTQGHFSRESPAISGKSRVPNL